MSAREQGAQALKSGNAQAAVQLLTQAVQQNPQDAQAHAYLGTAYGQLNQFAQAVECLSQASRLAPQSAPVRFNLAMALEKAGRRDQALATYREVLHLDSTYERARQALVRLGEAAPASAPSAPAPAPMATLSPAVPDPGASSVLSEFALGPAPGPPAAPAPPAPMAGLPSSPLSSPTPTAHAPPPSPYGAPPPPHGAPPSPYGTPPSTYGTPAAPAPRPPMGMQPLGDWTPPPGAPAPPGPQAAWQPAPPPVPQAPTVGAPEGVVMARVDNDGGLSRSAFMGNAYLSGMGMGVWWGLIGAIVVFLLSLTQITSSQLGGHMPRLVVICFMIIALGALAYGFIGLLSSNTDDPPKFGGIFGFVLGGLTATVLTTLLMGFGMMGIFGFASTVWVSWKMGSALGSGVSDLQASALVIAGPGSVVVSRTR